MRRKKYLKNKGNLRTIRLILVLMMLVVILGILTSMAYNETGIETVERLIYERQNVMNMYFASEIDYWDASSMLESIEADRLLELDKQALHNYFRTDIAEVIGCRIQEVELTLQSKDMLCATVEIIWETQELEGIETTTVFYSVICEKHENSFKLVYFF